MSVGRWASGATAQALVIGAGLAGSSVAFSLAQRGWLVTVLDRGDAEGAGASGLPAGLAAPHVSPDDNVLSRITRAGVQATLHRAQTLLQSGTDWGLTGVLEHNLAGKRRLPAQNSGSGLAAGGSRSSGDDSTPKTKHSDGPSNAQMGAQRRAHSNGHSSTQISEQPSQPASAAQIAAAGLPPDTPALWHSQAAWIRPRQLVAAQLQTPGVSVRWNQDVHAIERQGELWTVTDAQGHTLAQAAFLVVACAFDSLALLRPLPGFAVPLHPLRGQISYGLMSDLKAGGLALPSNELAAGCTTDSATDSATDLATNPATDLATDTAKDSTNNPATDPSTDTATDPFTDTAINSANNSATAWPPFPVNGHGSFISGVPTPQGPLGWFMGSTFERDCEQAPVRAEDHAANQVRLATLLPALGQAMAPHFDPGRVQGWAGLRCTLPNRLPAVGPIDPLRLPGLHLNTGMGARGISLSVLCGELTAAWLNDEPLPLPHDLVKHLAAARFASV